MVTSKEKMICKLFKIKSYLIYTYGFKTGLITGYNEKLMENLRKVYFGPFTLALLILDVEGCLGKCYDRATLIPFGFLDDDFVQVDADVDAITYNIRNIKCLRKTYNELPLHYGNHSFIERTLKDGRVVVYDTSSGLVYDKKLYYLLNRPKVTTRRTKEEIMQNPDFKDVIESNSRNAFNEDKYLLPMLLPILEKRVKEGDGLYKEYLLKEIEQFKKSINYKTICEERDLDMTWSKKSSRH